MSNGELASNKFEFGAHHILFGKLRPYLAKIACPDFEGICSTDILPILPGNRIDQRYLLHFLRHPKTVDWASGRATGVNLPRLSPNELASLEIPLPPLSEQRRIAAILDRADALRRKRKRALELLDTLIQAIFVEMFGDPKVNTKGWRELHLGEAAEFFSGNTLPEGEPFKEQADGYLLLKVSDLNAPRNSEVIVGAAGWSRNAGSKASTCYSNAIVFPKRGGGQ